MERTERTITCHDIHSLPTLNDLRALSRHEQLTIACEGSLVNLREEIGEQWKGALPGFLIGVHTIEPIITVSKLITPEEITGHQLFFEHCANEYRILATGLIHQLAQAFSVQIDYTSPLKTFRPFYGKKQTGEMGDWEYGFHGYDCAFVHRSTQQRIEVSLATGNAFGCLDPYFFTNFIKTTASYAPLPVAIYEDFHDGRQILATMIQLGRFEVYEGDQWDRNIVVVKGHGPTVYPEPPL